jgi:hypothetical protein
MRDYIPRNAGLLSDWVRNFADQIEEDPARYGLDAAAAKVVRKAVEAYVGAYTLAVSPQTRTKAAIAEKDQAQKAVIQVIRRYARQIKANPDIDPELKTNLGLPRSGSERGSVPAPTSIPVLQITLDAPLRHLVRYTDSVNALRRGKPADVIGLQLFCHVGQQPPADPLDARFVRFVTRQFHAVDFKPEQLGQRAFYYARWQTRTGETGPWSKVASMTVAG